MEKKRLIILIIQITIFSSLLILFTNFIYSGGRK